MSLWVRWSKHVHGDEWEVTTPVFEQQLDHHLEHKSDIRY